jgi:small ligand-binding sensory domain FIST
MAREPTTIAASLGRFKQGCKPLGDLIMVTTAMGLILIVISKWSPPVTVLVT